MINEKLKVGITGSSGFLGKNLQKRLEKNNEIYKFDGDITSTSELSNFFENDFNYLFHLAGKVPKYNENGIDLTSSYETNPKGTMKIVEKLLRYQCKLIFASTVGVYGKQKKPFHEEDSDLKPITSYTKSKLDSEKIILSSLPISQYTILRFSNIFGTDYNRKNLIENIARTMLNNKPLKLSLSEESVLDFLFISDAIDAFELAIRSCGIFNIGFGKSYSINEIINIFKEFFHFTSQVSFNKNNNLHIEVDTKKAKSVMNFKPKFSIHDGIREIYQNRKNL